MYHQHARFDRDEYVTIDWDNIDESMLGNFYVEDPPAVTTLGVAYDFGSTMHYPDWVGSVIERTREHS